MGDLKEWRSILPILPSLWLCWIHIEVFYRLTQNLVPNRFYYIVLQVVTKVELNTSLQNECIHMHNLITICNMNLNRTIMKYNVSYTRRSRIFSESKFYKNSLLTENLMTFLKNILLLLSGMYFGYTLLVSWKTLLMMQKLDSRLMFYYTT